MYKKIEEILANGKVRGIIVGDSLALVRLYVFARCRHVGVLEKGVKMKLYIKTLCSIGALMLCSEDASAMAEIHKKNGSTHPMVVQSFDEGKKSTGNAEFIVFPLRTDLIIDESIEAAAQMFEDAERKATETEAERRRIAAKDAEQEAKLKKLIKSCNSLTELTRLLNNILNVGSNMDNRKQLDNLMRRNYRNYYKLLSERQKIAAEDEAIESATQMFEEAEREAAQAASQVVARESYYSKFGQFFKSIWSRFANSRFSQVLKNIGQTLFSNR